MAAYGPNPTLSERLVDERSLSAAVPGFVTQMAGKPVAPRYDLRPSARYFAPRRATTIQDVLNLGYRTGTPVDDAGFAASSRYSLSQGL